MRHWIRVGALTLNGRWTPPLPVCVANWMLWPRRFYRPSDGGRRRIRRKKSSE